MTNSPPQDQLSGDSTAAADAVRRKKALNRVILVLVAVVVLVLLGMFASAVVPRWWAQRIGGVVNGSMTVGTGLGLGIGFLCTAAPLVFFGVAGRHLKSIGKAVSALLVGLVLALPNLITLAIVLGTGNAAHAGQRIFDVDAPGFRGGSAIGAAIGAVFALWLIYLMWTRRRRGEELTRLSAEEKARKADAEAARKAADQAQPPPAPER